MLEQMHYTTAVNLNECTIQRMPRDVRQRRILEKPSSAQVHDSVQLHNRHCKPLTFPLRTTSFIPS